MKRRVEITSPGAEKKVAWMSEGYFCLETGTTLWEEG
jgi:hypothetical protein